MHNNLTNKRYPKEINSEIYIDDNSLKNNNTNNKINFSMELTDILLNSLKYFFNSYESNDQKHPTKTKFIISFEDIISIVKESIIAQQKIDNLIYDYKNDDYEIMIQKINQKFIGFLSNSIYTLKLLDSNKFAKFKAKKQNLNSTSIRFPIKKRKNQFYNSQISSPSNIKNKINYIFENIYQEVFINDGHALKNIKKNKKENLSKLSHENMHRTKSAILSKKSTSPLNYYIISKNQELENSKNKRLFKTINQGNMNSNSNSNSTYLENKYKTAVSSNKKQPLSDNIFNEMLKSNKAFKSKKNKKKEKNKLQCSDIFMACENISKIKNSGMAKSLPRNNNYYQLNDFDDKDSILKKSLKNVAVIQDICNNSSINEIIGYEEINLKGGGIKKIIVSNTRKPSNFTNKLLISGQKFINDFKEIKQEEHKKKNN